MYDLIVLGAGAAGLAAAWEASRRGASVAVVDRAPVAGRKVRIAGGGKGNVTNRIMGPEWFVGEQPEFCAHILRRIRPERILSLLEHWHIPIEEREEGQIFCLTPAARLVETVCAECVRQGVTMLLRHEIMGVEHLENVPDAGTSGTGGIEGGAPSLFRVRLRDATERDSVCDGRNLLIALGGPAWPQAGASDYGQRIARQWGHKVVPTRPVLVPFIMPQDWPLHGLAGISLPVKVQTHGPHARAFTRPMLFTHKGVSGPAMLHASCSWRSGQPGPSGKSCELGESGESGQSRESLTIDFLPGADLRALMHDPAHGKLLLRTLLGRHLPDRLVDALLQGELAELVRRKVAELGKAARANVQAAVHEHTVTPLRTEGLAKAEASAGGVATADVNPRTLESRLQPGLFFAGEVLDVTGLLGGYNLHWAWASGLTVGGGVKIG